MIQLEQSLNALGQSFVKHFQQFGAQFYCTDILDSNCMSEDDAYWLSEIGLPSEGIPFLYFDTLLTELREVRYADGAIIIGTAFDVTSRDYVVVTPDGEVWIRCLDDRHILVNSSVSQLCQSILAYSAWLSDHESLYMTGVRESIDEESIFNLYCELRDIDRRAFDGMSLWPEVVHADHSVLVEVDNMDHPA